MDNSFLYDLLFKGYIYDYRKELEQENNDEPSKLLREARVALKKNLSTEQLRIVDDYKYYLTLREEYIDRLVGIKILNYGVKIGMQLHKAFYDEEK